VEIEDKERAGMPGLSIYEELTQIDVERSTQNVYRLDDGALTRIKPNSERRFAIRFADTDGHRNAASMLVQKMYSWRGYETATGTANSNFATNGIVLAASDRSGTLGTLMLTLDSPEGLAADKTYPDKLNLVRAIPGSNICELGRLALDTSKSSKWVLASLFHIAYIYGRVLNKVTDVFIEVNPRHVLFYKAMLGFTVEGEERMCPRVKAPAVLLRLPLSYVDAQIEKYGGRSDLAGTTRSLYPYFFSKREQEGLKNRILDMGDQLEMAMIKVS
jgi:hypothetical protein